MSTTVERVTVRGQVPPEVKAKLDQVVLSLRRFDGAHAGDTFSAALLLGLQYLSVAGSIPSHIKRAIRG